MSVPRVSIPSVPIPDLTGESPAVTSTTVGPELQGSRCVSCGALGFPARTVCYRCGAPETSRHSLGAQGVLYTWTTVHVSTSRPTPYDVGYVDLVVDGEALRVFGQLVPAGGGWQLGQRMAVRRVEDTDEAWAFTAAVAGSAS